MSIQVSTVYSHLYKLFMYSCLCSFISFLYSSIYLCNQFAYYLYVLFYFIN